MKIVGKVKMSKFAEVRKAKLCLLKTSRVAEMAVVRSEMVLSVTITSEKRGFRVSGR